MFDAVIVGGGPAGMAAALTLGRAHRTALLLDAGEGRNASAEAVHNFLTRDGTPPADLRALGREELARYPSVQVRAETVIDVKGAADGGFHLDLSDGGTAGARRLLLATGLADDLPEPRGVEALWGRSAFHCPYCHGYECTGKRVAVIGAAPARVRLALQLSRFAADVALCTGGEPLDPPSRATLEANGVTVRREPIARLEATGDRLEQIVFAEGEPLDRDAMFVVNVPRQRSDLAERLGCTSFADASVEVDEFGRTSVAGVFAAGDMARRATVPMPLSAVIAAAASGTVAGAVIDQDLLCDDFDLPNPFAPAKG
ncbi:NAD(P)/FAD-dependent oxidoreductase [Actinomadura roseirufa]|uniref:NAD(P)/FAD-dependent oxidoreductase n=1 Tax=Actinomadura roseirufa TaxID=2094049 RepID=UPI001041709B|nr:NAD(P)/FAD-dependent oxidoreductase [Actinomadura roseirufa]